MVTQTLLALPMIGLYLLGVGVAWLFGRQRRREAVEAGAVAPPADRPGEARGA